MPSPRCFGRRPRSRVETNVHGPANPAQFGGIRQRCHGAARNNQQLGDFLPASHFDVRGLKNRYWRPGVGTPLTAHAHVIEDEPQVEGLFIPNIRVAVTAILDFEDIGAQLRSGKAEATLKLYADTDTVDISGVTLPLESEPSVALAQTVVELDPWQNEISSFVGKVLSRRQGAHRTYLSDTNSRHL